MEQLILPEKPTFKDFQHYVHQLENERGFLDDNVLQKCLLLGEEIGELFKTIRKDIGAKVDNDSRFKNIEHELADILVILCTIANRYKIDLEKAFREKEEINKKRVWTL